MPSSTAPVPIARCDDLDRRLLALLVADVRATNRHLARESGISEWAVADRLQRLREERLLATTLVVDWRLAGFDACAFAFLRLKGDHAESVARALQGHPKVQSISRVLGAADVIVNMLAEDLGALRAFADELGEIKGVASLDFLPIVDYHRYVFDRMPLPLPKWKPRTLLASDRLALDEMDYLLLESLIDDAHQSNREIARRLGVSENTIRSRLRRLDASGLVRVIAMFDPFALGEAVSAYFAVRAPGKARARLVKELAARAEIAAVATCIGEYDVAGVALGASFDGVTRFLDQLRGRPGVERLAHFPITGSPVHRYYLSRLL